MKKIEFNKLLEQRINLINEVLLKKSKEYVKNDNSFHNFEKGGNILNTTPEKVLNGFLLKHLISYFDMLEDSEKNIKHTEEYIREKFGDIINYFIIQEIQFLSKINKK